MAIKDEAVDRRIDAGGRTAVDRVDVVHRRYRNIEGRTVSGFENVKRECLCIVGRPAAAALVTKPGIESPTAEYIVPAVSTPKDAN